MASSAVRTCLWVQWWILLFAFCGTTIALGGVHPLGILGLRLLLVFSLILQVVLVISEKNYFSDFHPFVLTATLVFCVFLSFTVMQSVGGSEMLHQSRVGSLNSHATFDGTVQLVIYSGFFFIFLKFARYPTLVMRLGSAISILVFVVILLGFVQRLSASPVLWQGLMGPGKNFGPFSVDNHFGGFLGLTFPLILATTHYSIYKVNHERRLKPDLSGLEVLKLFMKRGLLFRYLLMIMSLAACFFAGARPSSLVLIVVLAAYVLIYVRKSRVLFAYGTVFLIAGAAVVIMGALGADMIRNGFDAEVVKSSIDARLSIWNNSFAVFKSHPIFGIGLDAIGHHSMNHYLELLAETGVVGFGLFVATILCILCASLFLGRSSQTWHRNIAIQATLAVLAIAAMEVVDFHLKTPAVALFFVFQLALLLGSSSVNSLRSRENEKNRFPLAPKLILSSVLICMALSLSWYSIFQYVGRKL